MALVATTFFDSVKMIAAEKGIADEEVFKAVEEALAKAAEKYFQSNEGFYGNFQAQLDRERYPDIITANAEGGEPFYTNSTQLPVSYSDDILRVLDGADQ